MKLLPFIKMHGCGNDYVFVDAMAWNATASGIFDFAAVAQQVSDRHRSIGGDGLVAMLTSDRSDADARMRMFNADGSEGTLCGNALRCMAMWLHQSGRCGPRCRIEMHDRVIAAEILISEPDLKRAKVRVVIGTPVVMAPAATGLQQYVRRVTLPDVMLHGQPLELFGVSMGNPHAIAFVYDVKSLAIDTIGPQVENHPEFPHRTNVEFVQVTEANSAIVRVWERGSGETEACGSGACATGVMGWATGRFQPFAPVQIRMTGGDLIVRLTGDHVVTLEGPAEESYRGEVQLALRSLDSPIC
ncbi:MAG: diaminopimelate epimerase [Planctomycetaceae bacterium]